MCVCVCVIKKNMQKILCEFFQKFLGLQTRERKPPTELI